MRVLRLGLLAVFILVAVALVVWGRALFRARRTRLLVEARQREAEFLRTNISHGPPD